MSKEGWPHMVEYINNGPWTQFMDMHSGGYQNTPYAFIYIQADEEIAAILFERTFNEDPYDCNCSCCGRNYSISTEDTLEAVTDFERRVSPFWRDQKDPERVPLLQYIKESGAYFMLRDGTELTFEEDEIPNTSSEAE